MPLDINLFRDEKGGDVKSIKKSQLARNASVELIDEIIELDKSWRSKQYDTEQIKKN